jgi:ABC-type amino acid transport substrate-binding protein
MTVSVDRPFKAYKGDDPFIFVSYAHEDAEHVFPELQWLRDQGFNLWYDEGISPGSEWRGELAEAISGSALVLFFVSPRSVESVHCTREVSYALDNAKQFLAIHIEQTTLPPSLALSLNSLQAILQYELADTEFRLKFVKGISKFIERGIAQATFESPTEVKQRLARIKTQATVVGGVIGVVTAGLVAAMLTGIFGNSEQLQVLQRELSLAEESVSGLETRIADLSEQNQQFQSERDQVFEGLDTPTQLSPASGSNVVGETIPLRWTHPDDSAMDDFLIEVRPVALGESSTFRGINKREMQFFFEVADGEHGDYIWRIKKGTLESPAQWSQWSQFTTFESAIDRIRDRGEVLVGVVPAYRGPFIYRQGDELVGYDVEVMRWLVEELSGDPDLPELELTFVETEWDNLLSGVEQQRFDLALGSLSKPKSRKQRYRQLRFSEGYIDVAPILVSAEQLNVAQALRGSVVGVTHDTTNETAARSLIPTYDIIVDADSEYYSGLRTKLSTGEITFALVDNLLAGGDEFAGFYRYDISSILTETGYLIETFDEGKEQYAIAVLFEPGEQDSLLDRINSIISSAEGRQHLAQLRARSIPEQDSSAIE